MNAEKEYIISSGNDKIKQFSQFFTPYNIAQSMTDWVLKGNPKTLLDPAVGNGVFFRNVPNEIIKSGYEIDPNIVNSFSEKNDINYQINYEDYLLANWDLRYDGIVCNPPYNKFQAILNRESIRLLFKTRITAKLSGLTNQYALFLMKALYQLNVNGRLAFIIPAEFMNAGYGEIIKQYLIDTKSLKSIFYFSENLRVFDQALTTTCIVLCEKNNLQKVYFKKIFSLDDLNEHAFDLEKLSISGFSTEYKNLDAKDKWISKFDNKIDKTYNTVLFKKYALAKRGIATGANDYFVFNRLKMDKFKLREGSFLKCITKANDVKFAFYTETDFDELKSNNKNVYLFNGNLLPTRESKEYIEFGERLGINKTYLTNSRNPWYKIEDKEIAPILINVFSRNRLKIVRNVFGVSNLTCFHGVYLNENKVNYTDVLFLYLLTPIAQNLLYRNKRQYGNGLDKFEPNDINNAEILDFDLLSNESISKLRDLYKRLKINPTNQSIMDEVIAESNQIFTNYL